MATNPNYKTKDIVDGVNLKEILENCKTQKKNIDTQACIYVAIEILKMLTYTHGNKDLDESTDIVHQNIHPSNVLVSFWGQVKLSDFEPATPSSDLFSVGMLLYEMLTLHHPFGESQGQGELPDISTQLSSLNPDLTRIVKKALQKNPKARYKSAKEFCDELLLLQDTKWSMHGQELLEKFLTNLIPLEKRKAAKINNEPTFAKLVSKPTEPKPMVVEKKSKKWPLTIALGLAALLIGGGAWMLLNKKEAPRELSEPTITVDTIAASEKPTDTKISEPSNRMDVPTLATYTGSLEIDGPAGTVIILNDKKMGVLPLDPLIVPSRAYLLIMRHKKLGEKTKMVNVGNQQAVQISW